MKLDVYALQQSAQDISFISHQRKQARKYDALASSPSFNYTEVHIVNWLIN